MVNQENWIDLWVQFEKLTGKAPSPASTDPTERKIYQRVYFNYYRGKEEYVEFWNKRINK